MHDLLFLLLSRVMSRSPMLQWMPIGLDSMLYCSADASALACMKKNVCRERVSSRHFRTGRFGDLELNRTRLCRGTVRGLGVFYSLGT